MNFDKMLLEVMKEKSKTIKNLVENNIISEDSFYQYKNYIPNLKHSMAIANYLEVSLDYILGNIDFYDFKTYKEHQTKIYDNIIIIMKSLNVSKYRICKDLGISIDNFARWQKGNVPKFSTIIEISKYLNCRIDDILERESI